MKRIIPVLIFVSCIFIVCFLFSMEEKQKAPQLSEFIIGKWRADRDNANTYGPYHEAFFIKFINKHRLLFCNERPNHSFCDFFNYQEMEEGILFLDNDRILGAEWYVKRNGDDLNICIWNESNCLLFTRDTSNFDFKLEVLGKLR